MVIPEATMRNKIKVSGDSPNDLPLFSTIAQASRHDSVTHTYALNRMINLYPEFNFTSDILDSAHDNYATYDYLEHYNIEPFIALNEKNKGNRKYDPPLEINDYGIPICKGGFLMVYNGFCKDRCRFNCEVLVSIIRMNVPSSIALILIMVELFILKQNGTSVFSLSLPVIH